MSGKHMMGGGGSSKNRKLIYVTYCYVIVAGVKVLVLNDVSNSIKY